MRQAIMISVIIPAYNEEGAILQTIEGVRRAMEQLDCEFEILIVDDGSSDRTAELAQEGDARVISKVQNSGYGHALKLGIEEAKFDDIVILDADGTYPTESIPALVELYRRGFDLVVGARTGPHYRESIIKSPLRRILKLLVEFTAGRTIPDVNSGLRVFSRQSVIPFFPYLSDGFSFTTSQTLVFILSHMSVFYSEIPYHKRWGKSKVRTVRDSLRMLQYIVECILYFNPLKLFILLSTILIFTGAVVIFAGWNTASSITILAGVLCVLFSILVFSVGLVASILRQMLSRG